MLMSDLDESTRHLAKMLKEVYKDAYKKDKFGLKSSIDELGRTLSDSLKQGSSPPQIGTVDPLFTTLLRSMVRVQDAEFSTASSKVTAQDLRGVHQTMRAILTQWQCTKDVQHYLPRKRTTEFLWILKEKEVADPLESICADGKARLQDMVQRQAQVDLIDRESHAVYVYATTKAESRFTGTGDFGKSEAIYGMLPLIL